MRYYKITTEGKVILQHPILEESVQYKKWFIVSPGELEGMTELGNAGEILRCFRETKHLSNVLLYGDYHCGVLEVIEKHPKYKSIYFYVDEEVLILVVEEELTWLRKIEEEIVTEKIVKYRPSYILCHLLERVIERHQYLLNELESKIQEVEELVLQDQVEHVIQNIIFLRKKMAFYKRHFASLLNLVADLKEEEADVWGEKIYFRRLYNRTMRLNEQVLHLGDYITQVREAYDSSVDIKLNKIMKVFTLVTTIFLPLTLIAGWYGMNFKYMPELEWRYGYLYVISLSIISSIICILWFKREKWF